MEQESLPVQESGMTEGTQSHTESSAQSERMIPQSQVNEIVGRVRKETAERASRVTASAPTLAQHDPVGYNPDQYRDIAREEANKVFQSKADTYRQQVNEEQGQRFAQQFISKLEAGKSKYSDFDTVVGNLPFANMTHIVQLADGVDNTAEVMYELGNNVGKIGHLTSLYQVDPSLARTEMQKLSASIKANESAKHERTAQDPLSQIKSSPIKSDDGSMSVTDYMKMFR